MCICYNVLDRENEHPIWTKNGPPLVLATPWGALLFFYAGKAPSRLLVAFVVTVQPFDDVVQHYTAHDSSDERDEQFHTDHLLPVSRYRFGDEDIIPHGSPLFHSFFCWRPPCPLHPAASSPARRVSFFLLALGSVLQQINILKRINFSLCH